MLGLLACTFSSLIKKHQTPTITTTTTTHNIIIRKLCGDKWNDAWETAWLPDDLSPKNRAPWETDVNFSTISDTPHQDLDEDTKAFVEDMSDNWDQRKMRKKSKMDEEEERLIKLKQEEKGKLLENVKRDYRVKKQRVHAGLWVKEIEKMEEAKLVDSARGDLDTFLDTASEIFESGSSDLKTSKVGDSWDMKNKPDGWETTAKGEDGNMWDMSQREEDILVQEYERRIAFSKFQIASFIKQHIFSRRRPIDGWKYMIEELGPNARRGSKGSVSRLPSLADPATQPFKEEKTPISTTYRNTNTNTRGR